MKKQLLLGSTALIVGALAVPGFAVAEEKVKLEVRGYANQYFGLGDVDNDSNAGQENTSEFSDGEIHFKGRTTLDNGLTVGVHVELEFNESGDQIDEQYVWLRGDFGKLVIGSENLPDYLTFWGVTAPNVGVPINSGWISVFAPIPDGVTTGFRSSMQTTNLTLTNDTFQIGYQSPRFSGFQFVVGYAPTDASSGNPKNAVTDEDAELTNIISVGANFSESFNGVDVGLAVGYEHADGPSKAGTAQTQLNIDARTTILGNLVGGTFVGGFDLNSTTLTDAQEDEKAVVDGILANDKVAATDVSDPQIFKVGASIGSGGFSIAGSYGVYDSDGSDDGISYDIGASYSTGPWGVSVAYFHGEEEGTAGGGDDEVDAVVGAVSYSLGPGIKTSLSILYAKWEDEGGVVESESTMGILGLAISF
ncbi:MAG: porin [Proteobacteria bacterium]|nr:porin [Pseudomonadota bacterium]